AEALAQVAAEETEENPWGRALAAIVSAYVMHSGDTRPRVAIGRSEVRDVRQERGAAGRAAKRAMDAVYAYVLEKAGPDGEQLRQRAAYALEVFLLTQVRQDSQALWALARRAIQQAAQDAETTQAAVAAMVAFLGAKAAEQARAAWTEATARLRSATNAPRVGFEDRQAIDVVNTTVRAWSTPVGEYVLEPVQQNVTSRVPAAPQEVVEALAVAYLVEPEQRPAAIAHAVDRLVHSVSDQPADIAVSRLYDAFQARLRTDQGAATDDELQAIVEAETDAAEALMIVLIAATARDPDASERWIGLYLRASEQLSPTDDPAEAADTAVDVAERIAAYWSGDHTVTELAAALTDAATLLATQETDSALATLRAALAAGPVAAFGEVRQVVTEAFESVASWYGDSSELAKQRATRAINEAVTRWAGEKTQLRQLQSEWMSGTASWSSPVLDAAQRALTTFQAYLLGRTGPDGELLRSRADHALQIFLLLSDEADVNAKAQKALDALRTAVELAARHGRESDQARQAASRAVQPVAAMLRARAADFLHAATFWARTAVEFAAERLEHDSDAQTIDVVQGERLAWRRDVPADNFGNVRAARDNLADEPGLSAHDVTKALLTLRSSVRFPLGVIGVVDTPAELTERYPGLDPAQFVDGVYVGEYAGRPTTIVVAARQFSAHYLRRRVLDQQLGKYGLDLIAWDRVDPDRAMGPDEATAARNAWDRFAESFRFLAESGAFATNRPEGATRKFLERQVKPALVRAGLLPETAKLDQVLAFAAQIARADTRTTSQHQPMTSEKQAEPATQAARVTSWVRQYLSGLDNVILSGRDEVRFGQTWYDQDFVVTVRVGDLAGRADAGLDLYPETLDPVITLSEWLDSPEAVRRAVDRVTDQLAATAALITAANTGRVAPGAAEQTERDAVQALLTAMGARPGEADEVTRVEAAGTVRTFVAARSDESEEYDAETTLWLAAITVATTLADAEPDGGQWYKNAVFYQALVRAYRDGDGDGYGDL
ncbi:hypothetical protein, partial [Kribbella sp.]|uniref:hypothetical protein n=1 Tax=Kribbella sp. TaxID=1871183 RepID=UPI002D476782